MASFTIRPATAADAAAITAIYNQVVATSTAVFRDDPAAVEDRLAYCRERWAAGYPVFVALDEEGAVAGFSTFGEFRHFQGYRKTVEHSVHVAAGSRGQGIGSALIEALFPPARALGKHMMIGVIDGDNAGSIRLHERLGFTVAGRLREVGIKYGRYLDVVFVQRALD